MTGVHTLVMNLVREHHVWVSGSLESAANITPGFGADFCSTEFTCIHPEPRRGRSALSM